jgi:phage replication-related protein YjqB (UPF0714/DUF867 family)
MADIYGNFAELSARERSGADYRIDAADRGSRVAIIAPHGGKIEPGTSEIARSVAATEFNLYCFEGMKPADNKHLHVTSSRFDEPACLALVKDCDVVVAVHGCKDRDDRQGNDCIVYLGGLDGDTQTKVGNELRRSGFDCGTHADSDLQGRHPRNICNRGARNMGVQLEISRTLRDGLVRSPADLAKFAAAVRRAITGSSR